jgi:cytochrome P450
MGTLVALPQRALHTDGDIYSNPDEFDGFRFSEIRKQEEGDVMVVTHQTVSTSSEHLAFGLGRHQW